jgi:hypothetical protein
MINEIKEDMNKYLKEFQENTNKEVNKIRKIMKDMKKGFGKDIEVLKKIKLKFWK